MCKYTPIIRQLITQSRVYVCAHGDKVRTTVAPIKYIIQDGVMSEESDFQTKPYQHGKDNGSPILNVKNIEKKET